jgi:hypothetical protein
VTCACSLSFSQQPSQPFPASSSYIIFTMPGLVSAAGLVGFLSEDPELASFALKTLDGQVDTLWTELANSIGEMYDHMHTGRDLVC